VRGGLGIAASAVAVVLLGWSACRDVPHTWRLMRIEHAAYASYTPMQREQAFGDALPLPMDVFAWYRQWLRPGDRYWIQIEPSAFSTYLTKQDAVRDVARLYLLPAIQVSKLSQANVVISWDDDPSKLHVPFAAQERSGQQNIFVSWIAR
jgi:hypothetical protein